MMLQTIANASRYFPFCPKLYWNFVDVRDVAQAAVKSLEGAEVRDSRVIVSNDCFSLV